jgi:DNA-directed RNA polymerase III subunit RPC1
MARPWHQPAEAPAPLVCTKEPFAEREVPRKIQEIKFGIMTPQDVLRCGVLHVHERSLYLMPERTPHPDGVLDRRLGISSKVAACETCGLKLADCAGHFGYVALELPVFHIGYFKATLQVLQCICKTCSHLLLPDSEKRRWARRFRSPRAERVPREAMLRRVAEACKRARVCPHCGAHNGVVKKAGGALKIVHEAYAKASDGPRQLEAMTASAVAYNDAIAPHVARIADDLHPLRARALLEAVPDDVLDVLDIGCRPEDLILTVLPVPPVTIRPSVDMDGASNEDDITMKLMVRMMGAWRHAWAHGVVLLSLPHSPSCSSSPPHYNTTTHAPSPPKNSKSSRSTRSCARASRAACRSRL